MKLIYNLYIVSIIVLLNTTTNIYAQVTIGSGITPAKGLLLQIKDSEPSTPTVNNNVTATKGGFLLPRVAITKINDLRPLINAATPAERKQHEGLMVYNTNTCLTQKGEDNDLYVWDGGSWRRLGMQKENVTMVDFVVDVEGNKYKTREFGLAGMWMIENLKTRAFADGVDITGPGSSNNGADMYFAYPGMNPPPNPLPTGATGTTNGTDPYYYNNQPTLGFLYSWPAATKGSTSTGDDANNISQTQIQGVCPKDWHLPSDYEWNQLEREIYASANLYSTYTSSNGFPFPSWQSTWNTQSGVYRPSSSTDGHGRAMRSPCNPEEIDNQTNGRSKPSRQGGFNVYASGRLGAQSLKEYGSKSSFWTSSSANGTTAWSRTMSVTEGGVHRVNESRPVLLSVRCKRNW